VFALSAILARSATNANITGCRVVALSTLDFNPNIAPEKSARLEVRLCGGNRGALYLVLWSRNQQEPSIVLDTSDFGVVQMFAKENVVLVETSGGNRDQVYVFRYRGGIPELSMRQVTKGQAEIESKAGSVRFIITGIFAGGAPERSRMLEFATDLSELTPRN
jgi:hypothetical protein